MGRVDDPDYPNKYPAEDKAPGFKEWMDGFFSRAQGLSLDLMRSLEIAMELPQNALVDRCQGNASELRMLYYPQVHRDDLKDGKSMRIWPHTDFGILTLLVQGSTSGL
jgi:isopenicillin N synthase-like dioxygenase